MSAEEHVRAAIGRFREAEATWQHFGIDDMAGLCKRAAARLEEAWQQTEEDHAKTRGAYEPA